MGFPPDDYCFPHNSTHWSLERFGALHVGADHSAFVRTALRVDSVNDPEGRIEVSEENGRRLKAGDGVEASVGDRLSLSGHLPKSISRTPLVQRPPIVSASDLDVKTPATTQFVFSV